MNDRNIKIIIGLGNPKPEYERTRHNVGFLAVDAWAEKHEASWKNDNKTGTATVRLDNLILVKPLTFMNNSGQAVRAILDYYHLLPKRFILYRQKNADLSDWLTVIHDDLDIELGRYKIASGSRSAGHRGVQSIIDSLKTKNFRRIRIGIRTELAGKVPAEKFVLAKFGNDEMLIINRMIAEIIEST